MGKHHHERRPYYRRHPYRVAFVAFVALVVIAVLVVHLLPVEWGAAIGASVGALVSFLEKEGE